MQQKLKREYFLNLFEFYLLCEIVFIWRGNSLAKKLHGISLEGQQRKMCLLGKNRLKDLHTLMQLNMF